MIKCKINKKQSKNLSNTKKLSNFAIAFEQLCFYRKAHSSIG